MGLRMKNCTITGFTKTAIFFRGEGLGVGKNQYIGRNCLKMGLGRFADLKETWRR